MMGRMGLMRLVGRMGLMALAGSWMLLLPALMARQPVSPAAATDRGFTHSNDRRSNPEWSVHVVRMDRRRGDLGLATTLGGGERIGMSTLSDQVAAMSASEGTPLAAVNGDFYMTEDSYRGDPRDVHVRRGELISAPSGHACFWLDPQGEPRSTNITSRLQVFWPDGKSSVLGLNEMREADEVVVYTAANGATTRTEGGTECVLERVGEKAWLPVRPGVVLEARVAEVRRGGNSAIPADRLVLSVGPRLSERGRGLAPGHVLRLAFDTFPDLKGVQLALGGGPTLVRAGKPMTWSGFQVRHPRTAMGWNSNTVFLVVVDGRQPGLSVGMTFPELAQYMATLGCQEAVNLDGGGSASMWVLGQVVSSPSEGRERPGANALVLVRRPVAAAGAGAPSEGARTNAPPGATGSTTAVGGSARPSP